MRKKIADNSFTHFMYLEDDIRVTKENIVYWLNARKALKIYNLIPSYVRTEINFKDKEVYVVDSTKKNYFIKIAPLNKNLGTENVLNTNFCEISVCSLKDKNKLLILSAIDNLVKGAAGQAVQNMNVIFGYKENLGLL